VKIKCRPDDFRVEELTAVQPGTGPFAFYRLSKQSLGTPEAVEAILRRWNIARARLATGGLKDRHASTIQYLTTQAESAANAF
jgi:tRNA pseudouridine13 synthase